MTLSPMFLLARLLRTFIRTGSLILIDADGQTHSFGDGGKPSVTGRVHDRKLYTRLALNPELYAAEAYMDGTLTFEAGSGVGDLLMLFSVNRKGLGAATSQKLLRSFWRSVRRQHQANTVTAAKANARSHYDVPVEVYRLFLDEA